MKLKTILFIICFFVFSGKGIAQVSGTFYYAFDQGQLIIYFQGTNWSRRDLHNVKVKCVDEQLKQQWEITLEIVASGSPFIVGPGRKWMWQMGEKLYITYADGKTLCWECKLHPLNCSAESKKTVVNTAAEIEIEQLRYKIREGKEYLREYEQMNARNPSAVARMFVREQMKLIQDYQEKLYVLVKQLYD